MINEEYALSHEFLMNYFRGDDPETANEIINQIERLEWKLSIQKKYIKTLREMNRKLKNDLEYADTLLSHVGVSR